MCDADDMYSDSTSQAEDGEERKDREGEWRGDDTNGEVWRKTQMTITNSSPSESSPPCCSLTCKQEPCRAEEVPLTCRDLLSTNPILAGLTSKKKEELGRSVHLNQDRENSYHGNSSPLMESRSCGRFVRNEHVGGLCPEIFHEELESWSPHFDFHTPSSHGSSRDRSSSSGGVRNKLSSYYDQHDGSTRVVSNSCEHSPPWNDDHHKRRVEEYENGIMSGCCASSSSSFCPSRVVVSRLSARAQARERMPSPGPESDMNMIRRNAFNDDTTHATPTTNDDEGGGVRKSSSRSHEDGRGLCIVGHPTGPRPPPTDSRTEASIRCSKKQGCACRLCDRARCRARFTDSDGLILYKIAEYMCPRSLCVFQCLYSSARNIVLTHDNDLWPKLQVSMFGEETAELLNKWAERADISYRQALVFWQCRTQWWQESEREEFITTGIRGMAISIDVKDNGDVSCAIGGSDGDLGFFRGRMEETTKSPLLIPTQFTHFQRVQVHGRNQSVTAVRHCGDAIITAGADGLVRSWIDEREMHQKIFPVGINGFDLSNGNSTNDSGSTWACASLEDGRVCIFDVSRDIEVGFGDAAHQSMLFHVHKSSAYCCRWRDPRTVLSGGMDRKIFMIDRRTNRVAQHWNTSAHVFALETDGHMFYSAQSNNVIAAWDSRRAERKSGCVIHEPMFDCRGHRGSVEALSWCTGGLASCGADGQLRIWRKTDGSPLAQFTTRNRSPLTTMVSYEDSIWCAGPMTELLHFRLPLMPAQKRLWKKDANHRSPCATQVQPRNVHDGDIAPPEGIGRHSDLRRSRSRCSDVRRSMPSTSTGAFDRSMREKQVPIGATGRKHRDNLAQYV